MVSSCRRRDLSRLLMSMISWSTTAWPIVSLKIFSPWMSTNRTANLNSGWRLAWSIVALKPVKEQAAIGQAGKRVMKGLVFELFFHALALGDIAVDDNKLRHLALAVADGAGGGFQNAPVPSLWRMRYSSRLPTPVWRAPLWPLRSRARGRSGCTCSSDPLAASSFSE